MTTLEPIPTTQIPARRFQKRPQAHLVSGLRRLRRSDGHHARAGDHWPARRTKLPSSRASVVPAAFRVTPRPTGSTPCMAVPCPSPKASSWPTRNLLVLVASGDGDGFSIGGGHVAARHPAQHRPDLHRDGQPDLRPDQGAIVAHLAARAQDGHIEFWQPGRPGQSAALRHGLRRVVRGPRLSGGHGGPGPNHRRRHPFSRIRLHQRSVPLRDLRRGRTAAQSAKGQTCRVWNPSATIHPTAPRRPNARANTGPSFTQASSIAIPTRRRPTARA